MKRNKIAQRMLLGLFGSFFLSCLAASAPDVLTLGDNEKAEEILVLNEAKVSKLTKEQKSFQGLTKLSEAKRSPIVYFDDVSDGIVGFVGASQIAFASKKSWINIEHTTDASFEELFEQNKPMAYSDFLRQYQKKPTPPWPKVPVQITATSTCVFLSKRPSDYIAVKLQRGISVLEIVAVAKDKSNVKLKIHTGPELPKRALRRD